jgi:hypothetical protein
MGMRRVSHRVQLPPIPDAWWADFNSLAQRFPHVRVRNPGAPSINTLETRELPNDRREVVLERGAFHELTAVSDGTLRLQIMRALPGYPLAPMSAALTVHAWDGGRYTPGETVATVEESSPGSSEWIVPFEIWAALRPPNPARSPSDRLYQLRIAYGPHGQLSFPLPEPSGRPIR